LVKAQCVGRRPKASQRFSEGVAGHLMIRSRLNLLLTVSLRVCAFELANRGMLIRQLQRSFVLHFADDRKHFSVFYAALVLLVRSEVINRPLVSVMSSNYT